MANRTLVRGTRGEDVRLLQQLLQGAGFDPGTADGIGTRTEKAVKDFQEVNGLTPDGCVGPLTWGALQLVDTGSGLGLSLHIGLNNVDNNAYGQAVPVLRGCLNDARDMLGIANSQGYKPAPLLLDQDATADAVITAIGEAACNLSAGDMFLLTYSGHGSQMPDPTGEEVDGMDETWVLYDRQLLDDELYALWGEFQPGVRILVLSDSCHSGTVARQAVFASAAAAVHGYEVMHLRGLRAADLEPTPIVRSLPADISEIDYTARHEGYQRVKSVARQADPIGASVLLISGCQDNQLSLDGARNGLFTQKLLETWGGGGFTGSYVEFHKRICATMPPHQTPNLFTPNSPPNVVFQQERPFRI